MLFALLLFPIANSVDMRLPQGRIFLVTARNNPPILLESRCTNAELCDLAEIVAAQEKSTVTIASDKRSFTVCALIADAQYTARFRKAISAGLPVVENPAGRFSVSLSRTDD